MASLISAASVLAACGTDHSGFGNIPDDTRELIEQSGAASEFPAGGLPADESLIVGRFVVNFEESPVENPVPFFRIAIMIVRVDGELVRDYFQGIPIPEGSSGIVGTGNHARRIPKLRPYHVDSYMHGMPNPLEHFPELAEGNVTLTFKEFRQPSYYLKNSPKGTAYLWLQTQFDGNRVTHFPIVLDLESIPGQVTRLDIYRDKSDGLSRDNQGSLFYML